MITPPQLLFEVVFWCPAKVDANTILASWAGKPDYVGGYIRPAVPNSPNAAWTVYAYVKRDSTPSPRDLPANVRNVVATPALLSVLGV